MDQSASLEREVKLEAPEGIRLDELGGEPIEPRRLTSVYYDTPDRRLLNAGLTLRRRSERGRAVWQLKLQRATGRMELQVDEADKAVPESFLSLVRNLLGDEPLGQLATLVTDRRGRRVEGVDVTLDAVHVVDGPSSEQSFTEIEAELIDGREVSLATVERRLRELGARPSDSRTKLERVAPPSDRGPSGRLRERAREAIALQLSELLSREPGARLGDDSDDIHHMRVAVRRLRSILRAINAPGARQLRDELGWIGEALGAVRDADVLSSHLRASADSLSGGDAAKAVALLEPLVRERHDAQQALVSNLDSERYRRLVTSLEAAAMDPAFDLPKKALHRVAAREFRKAAKRGDPSPAASAASLHKQRIRVKRARYLAELAEPLRPRRAQKLISSSKRLQDAMGQHQDAVVARRRLRQLARQAESKGGALVAGRLIEREENRIRYARNEVPKLWRRFEEAGTRAWR